MGPAERRLIIELTGEPVTITGHRRLEVELAEGWSWGCLLQALGRQVHPWFGALAEAGGDAPGLGPVLLLHEGRRLSLPEALSQPAAPGTMYVIPPIPGG